MLRFRATALMINGLGYTQLPNYIDALNERGYAIERQAVVSPTLAWFSGHGFFAPYQQKDQAGLTLYDRTGTRAS